MKGKFTALLLAILLFLPGCRKEAPSQDETTIYRVVTQITVEYHNGNIFATRKYSTDEKMQHILNYLRWIDPYGTPADDPEKSEGSLFRICLSFSDGSQKTYLQKNDRYMRSGNAPWKRIDPSKALELSRILGSVASDTSQ